MNKDRIERIFGSDRHGYVDANGERLINFAIYRYSDHKPIADKGCCYDDVCYYNDAIWPGEIQWDGANGEFVLLSSCDTFAEFTAAGILKDDNWNRSEPL